MPSRQRRLHYAAKDNERRLAWTHREQKRLGLSGGVFRKMKSKTLRELWAKNQQWDRVRHLMDINISLPKGFLEKHRKTMEHPCQCCGVEGTYRTWCYGKNCFGTYNGDDLKLKIWNK